MNSLIAIKANKYSIRALRKLLAPRARVMVGYSTELELEAGRWREKAGEDTEPKDGALEN